MKTQLRNVFAAVFLLLITTFSFAQAPPMGTAADFVLFTSVGAMQNVGTYQYLTLLTGNVGTNSGSNTNFGNVNGVMHEGNGVTAECNADLLIARDFLVAALHDSAIVNPVIGNDSTFKAGTYLFPASAVSLDKSLTLDAQGDPDAVFIFKMAAVSPVYAFSTSVNAKVKLINGAQACNVYWYISGAVSMAAGTSMKGSIIAGGAFAMGANDTLEGRALTINGQVTVDNGDLGFLGYLPVDIAASLPTGPAAPVFVESKQYAVFSTIGDVSDDGTSHVTGSVGSNSALPTGFDPLFVSGNIEGMNPATAGAAADLLLVYNSMSTTTANIELLAPAQFGHNLVLTPNAYVMNSAVTFTDTLILDATGNADAVFIIKTYGAFASGVHSNVILKNGTQAKNVFWMVNGAVSIGDSSVFNGTIVANNGAIDLLKGASLDGRALTTNGSISTTGMTTVLPIPLVSINPSNQYVCDGDSAGFVVSAIGMGSYTYQWRKGAENLSNGDNISGVTNDTLIIDSVSDSDTSSTYNVIVFDSLEPSDTTANASLFFNPLPSITKEPSSQAVCTVGDSAGFSVSATGVGLTYQWRKGNDNLTNTGNVSGATSETLTINPMAFVDTVSNYNVVVSNICGRNVTSANDSLRISSDLIIDSEPTNQTVCEGSSVSFSVSAIGAGLTYQWRKGTVNIAGATSAMLTIDPVIIADAASDYNVVIAGECAPNGTSINASLVVNPTPTAPTAGATLQPSCSVATGTITVSSSTAGLSFSIDGSTYTNTTGEFTSVAAGVYEVTAKNASGCVSTGTSVSIIAQVATPAPTVALTQPSCSVATGTITVNSSTTGLSFSIDGTTYTNTTGIFTSVDPDNYEVTAKNSGGCISTGTSATINAQPSITAPTVNLTQPSCSVATGTITVSSSTTDLSFSIDGSTYTNTTGIFAAVAAGTYEVTAQNADGCVSLGTSAIINAQPATPAAPTASATLQPSCSVATGTITVSSSTTGLSFSIDGATYTNTTGIFTSVAAGTYELTAQNADGCISLGTSVTINAQPATPAAPTASATLQPSCSLATGTITVSSILTDLSFSIDGLTYTNTTGIFASVAAGTYEVTAQNADGCVSLGTSVTINAQPATPVAPTVTLIQPSCSLATGTITVGSILTDLFFSIDDTTYTNTTGIFTSVVAGTYEVTAQNADGCISLATSVTINAQPATPVAPTVTLIQPNCSVATGTITVSSSTIDLFFSIDDTTYTDTTGIFTSVVAGTYEVTAQNADGCVSLATSVTINAQPATPVAPTASATLQPTCDVATGTITVSSILTDLSFSINGETYTNTSGEFTSVAAGTYEVTAQNADGCVSLATSVTINAQPATPEAPTVTLIQPTCTVLTGTITVSSILTDLSFSIDGETYTNTSGIFTSVDPGVYEVTVQNIDGCVSTGTTATLVECTTGIINNEDDTKSVGFYPNPFTNSIAIELNDVSLINNCELRIYNILGEEKIIAKITEQKTTFKTSKFHSGIYLYKVIANGKTIQSGKLISNQ
ncbi:MAG: ice-binding family protein [Salinivirgaceae bacterium]|jgi:polyisoprenoid-binding protein YceI|nr:ice-binding family protein [Salinivirgaceae bacterium]